MQSSDDEGGAAARTHRARTLYGRRKGKQLRARQAGLLGELLPRLSIDLANGRLDPARLFDADKERLMVEIGFGGGEHLAHEAARDRSVGFLGCEPFVNGVAKLLAQIDDFGLTNVRLHAGDGMELLRALPDACVDVVYLLYPDPWPKRRQRKRRFVCADSLFQVARVLKDGGEFRFASDIDDYLAWTLARVTRCEVLEWGAQTCRDWLEPWPDWSGTRYESKALAQGRRPSYLTFSRLARTP